MRHIHAKTRVTRQYLPLDGVVSLYRAAHAGRQHMRYYSVSSQAIPAELSRVNPWSGAAWRATHMQVMPGDALSQ